MNKITYKELCEAMKEHNHKATNERLEGVIVFSEDSFDQVYSLESRSYVVDNDNKAWRSEAIGYSIYGTSLDGSDINVRLENYISSERGGKNGWKVDYCYLLKE